MSYISKAIPKALALSAVALFPFLSASPATAQQLTRGTTGSYMQQCTSHSACAVVESRCGAYTEIIPMNRAYLGEMAVISGPLCELSIKDTGSLAPACVAGQCQAQVASGGERLIIREYAYEPQVAPDYSTLARDIDRELALIAPEDDRSGEFTAYDLPDELVRERTLASRALEERSR